MWPFRKKVVQPEERLPLIVDIRNQGGSDKISIELNVDGTMKVVDGTEEDFCEKIENMDFSKTTGTDIYVIWTIYQLILERVNHRIAVEKGVLYTPEEMTVEIFGKKALTSDET